MPKLTRRGRGLLAAAAFFLAVLARRFGSVELAGLAVAGGVAVVLAFVRLRSAAVPYTVERRLEPARVEAGGGSRARLRFTNRTSRPGRLPAVAADALEGAVARCIVPPIQPGEVAEVSPLPGPASRDARTGPARGLRAPVADDFFALREYELADDLRRVHWRSTARTGELMLREDEVRNTEVATVLVDTRRHAHTPESFERALEVGASLAAAVLGESPGVRGSRPLRFLTTAGFEMAVNQSRWPLLLDHLAAARPDRADRFFAVCDSLRRRPPGPLAVVVAGAEPAELAALGALGPRLGPLLVATLSSRSPAIPGAVVVPAMGSVLFAQAWDQAVRSCRPVAAGRR